MKRVVFYIVAILFPSLVWTQQNLVPNGDFENYSQCPDDLGQTDRAFPWYQASLGLSEYFNSCTIFSGLGFNTDVPDNAYGSQFARNGEGYGGFNCIYTNDYFEYLATPLSEPLIEGKQYCFNFWVSLADEACYALNQIGLYISVDSIYTNTDYHINVTPQIHSAHFIKDKEDWRLIEGKYIANGGEKYIAIGIFDISQIDTLKLCDTPFEESGSYYYIDKVSVLLCEEDLTPTPELTIEIPNVFTPNGDSDNDLWIVHAAETIDVIILNRWGNIVFRDKSKSISWDGNKQSDGVYYYIIQSEKGQETGYIQLLR